METPEQLSLAAGASPGKAGGAGDHFIVEELLDFSSIEDELGFDAASGSNTSSGSSSLTVAGGGGGGGDSYGNSLSGGEPNFSGDLISGDPYEELAELEWLSNFVEESFSSEDMETLQLISGAKAGQSQTRSGIDIDISSATAPDAANHCSQLAFLPEAPVPGKARSKRPRAAPCNWTSRLLALSPAPELSEPDVFVPVLNTAKKAPKLVKKKDGQPPPAAAAAADGRRCLHCATDKTPQWRTGPMGPKTLCNACGVRYKSGRLVPEYRPAASPTFMLSKHSNSHRKVLELRRQREMHHPQQQHHQFVHHHGGAAAAGAFDGDGFLIHNHIGPDFRQLI